VEFASLRHLLQSGRISEEIYRSVLQDLINSSGPHKLESTSLMVGKWMTTFYGFV